MRYEAFVEKAKQQDARNQFKLLIHSDQYKFPAALREFYIQANPVDVEIELSDSTSIKFFPAKDLQGIQEEYNLGPDTFVFASREGDPVFLKDDNIYTAVHGTGKWEPMILANSFDEFLMELF
jgi:hypothetical protein